MTIFGIWRVVVLRVQSARQGCLLEGLLPAGVALLPAGLAAIVVLLGDPGVYAPIGALWSADGGPADDGDGDVRAADGAQGADRLGV